MDKDNNGKAISGTQGYKSPTFLNTLLTKEKQPKLSLLLKTRFLKTRFKNSYELYEASTESIIERNLTNPITVGK